MARLIAVLFGVGLLAVAPNPASAEVWRCHTPTGDVWTNEPQGYGDCEEFAGTFSPNPPALSAPEQVVPPPPPAPTSSSVYESLPPPPPAYEPPTTITRTIIGPMDQGHTSTHHGSGSVLASGTAGTSEGIALAEAVGLVSAEDIAEGIASQARPRSARLFRSAPTHEALPAPGPHKGRECSD